MHSTKTILRHYKLKTHGIKPYKQFIVEVNVTEYRRGKYGQSRETSNIEYTRRRKKGKKKKKIKAEQKTQYVWDTTKRKQTQTPQTVKKTGFPQNNWR